MVHYFYGQDIYGARQAIGELAKKSGFAIHWVDREDLEQESLTTILDQAGSSLFGGQLVVVRDASSFPKALQGQVTEAIKESRSLEWIVWDRVEPDKRSTLFKAAKPHTTLFPSLEPRDLAVWIQKKFSNVNAAGAQELIRRIGADRWRILHELEKLSLVYEEVTQQVVAEEVPPAEAVEEIFPFLDALAAGNSVRAMQLLEGLLQAGNSELYILSMLGYQYKTLLAVATGNTNGLHPFVIQKNKGIASRYSPAILQDYMARIAATDFMIKQGKVDARTAVTMLVVSLTQAVAQKNRS